MLDPGREWWLPPGREQPAEPVQHVGPLIELHGVGPCRVVHPPTGDGGVAIGDLATQPRLTKPDHRHQIDPVDLTTQLAQYGIVVVFSAGRSNRFAERPIECELEYPDVSGLGIAGHGPAEMPDDRGSR